MRIFCELRSIFGSLAGAKKNTSNEQNVRSYYMLNHQIRGIIPLQKKIIWQFVGFYFLVRVFRDILIPSVRMTLTISKMLTRIICQTIEWEVNYFTAKEKWYFGFYAPFASAGIRPVVNRLNQETTVYYGLVFCLFSRPYMVKWHNSGIITVFIIWLNPQAGKVKRTLHSDWLPEWARWNHLARPGNPVLFPHIKVLLLAM